MTNRDHTEDSTDQALLSYWDARRDTKDIARLLGLTEAHVAQPAAKAAGPAPGREDAGELAAPYAPSITASRSSP